MSYAIFDQDEVMQRVDGNCELLCKIVDIFTGKYHCFLEQIHAGITHNDPAKVMRAAHNLKGMVSNFSAHPTSQLLEKLEDMGNSGDISHAEELLLKLQRHLDELCSALLAWENEALKHS